MHKSIWAGKVFFNSGIAIYELDEPVIVTDTRTDKLIRIREFQDWTGGGGYTSTNIRHHFINVTGSKIKKNGEFYGKFTTLNAPVPLEVREAIAAAHSER